MGELDFLLFLAAQLLFKCIWILTQIKHSVNNHRLIIDLIIYSKRKTLGEHSVKSKSFLMDSGIENKRINI